MQNIILCISVSFVTSIVAATQVTPDLYHESESNVVESARILSPGVAAGVTDYDWQANGSMGRRLCRTPMGGVHVAWIRRYGSNHNYRRVFYTYFYPPGYWLGPTAVFTVPSIGCGLGQMVDGRVLVAASAFVYDNWEILVAIDAAEGAGTFTIMSLPIPNPLYPIFWPVPCIDADNNVYISGTSEHGLYMIRSTDEGCTWSGWILVDSTGGHESWATFDEKTALVYQAGAAFENVFYWQTTDDGVTWTADTIFIPSPEDSVVGYVWNSAVYDNNGNLHAVFNCIDTSQTGQGGLNFSGCRSQIRHWNQETGQLSIVASGWWTLNPGPGTIHPTVSECQITIDRESGTLYCTWCQADSCDVAANGYTNLEIYGAYSTDNGTTWSVPVNITNSQSPGASAGACEHDWWQSIAEIVHNDTLYLFYMNDKDAGSSVWGEGIFTDNPMLIYLYYFPVGIEEQKPKESDNLTLLLRPNPVSQHLTISYALPQPDNVSLKLYGIDGRLVKSIYDGYENAGIHKEILDFSGIANGIYFVILETATGKQSCSVIVIHQY